VTILAIAGSTVWAATNGAEQNDSGWAVGIPSPLGYGAKSVDPHQQSILRGVLEDTQRPLLQKRSPSSSAQAGAEQAHAGMRFAVRPDGVDGWRAVGQSSTPLSGHGQVHVSPSLPALRAAKLMATDDANTDELDCSGDAVEPQRKLPTSPTGTPALADAYGKSSRTTPVEDAEEETCQGNPPAELQIEEDEVTEIVDDAVADDDDAAEEAKDDDAAPVAMV
jgi:hypothetical protein